MAELILGPLLGVVAVVMFTLAMREWRAQRTLQVQLRRLAVQETAEASTSVLRDDTGAPVEVRGIRRLLRRLPFQDALQRRLTEAGENSTVKRFYQISFVYAAVGCSVASLLADSPAFTVAATTAGALLPLWQLSRKRARRLSLFSEQLPDALETLVRAIRVGHPLTTALRVVGEESPEPIASEFRRVSEEQRFGMAFDQSMAALAERVGTVEVRIAVAGMILQRQVGGNLPEFIERVVSTLRERLALNRQIQAQTSQGRMSGSVLTALPVAMGAIISLISPGYLTGMFAIPAGQALLMVGAGLLVCGHFWIQRIVQIKV